VLRSPRLSTAMILLVTIGILIAVDRCFSIRCSVIIDAQLGQDLVRHLQLPEYNSRFDRKTNERPARSDTDKFPRAFLTGGKSNKL
jgi:hypothetical protein